MSLSLIGISALVSLLFLASLVLAKMRQVRSTPDNVQWPMQDGARVLATITDVQIRREWKEGERWKRSRWDGSLVRQKTLQDTMNMGTKGASNGGGTRCPMNTGMDRRHEKALSSLSGTA